MNTIKFAHNYNKLQYPDVAQAILLEVNLVSLHCMSKTFLDWDTQNGLLKLPKSGTYIYLLFAKDDCNLFTTLRRYTEKKYEFYLSKIGEMFAVEIIYEK